MKLKLLIIVLLSLIPMLLLAQGSGGEIRRSSRMNTNTPNNRSVTNSQRNNNQSLSKPQSKTVSSGRDAVLQNLINNMVRVEGGTFMMGATSEQGTDAYNFEKPAHQVTVSTYYIGKYEVTQEEWEAVMGSNPSYFKGTKRPVEKVSWNDCRAFIRKLNELTGRNFRLPTEAEWEFAARGGKLRIGYKYVGGDNVDNVAWYGGNSGESTHNVGQKAPNELGLYDMSGNVWEMCSDWFGDYISSPQTNPKGPSSGSYIVIRGGDYYSPARYCRLSIRNANPQSYQGDGIGLRLAL